MLEKIQIRATKLIPGLRDLSYGGEDSSSINMFKNGIENYLVRAGYT